MLAAGVPTLLGLADIIWVLFHQERLAFDDVTGRIRFQASPIYVPEPGHERTGHKCLYDPVLGRRNIPRWEAATFGQKLTTNAKGLRDRHYDRKSDRRFGGVTQGPIRSARNGPGQAVPEVCKVETKVMSFDRPFSALTPAQRYYLNIYGY